MAWHELKGSWLLQETAAHQLQFQQHEAISSILVALAIATARIRNCQAAFSREALQKFALAERSQEWCWILNFHFQGDKMKLISQERALCCE